MKQFLTLDGDRQVESIRLDGRPVLQVTTVHGALVDAVPARTIRQYRTVQGETREIILLAPVTIDRLASAGVPLSDLRHWGLAL